MSFIPSAPDGWGPIGIDPEFWTTVRAELLRTGAATVEEFDHSEFDTIASLFAESGHDLVAIDPGPPEVIVIELQAIVGWRYQVIAERTDSTIELVAFRLLK